MKLGCPYSGVKNRSECQYATGGYIVGCPKCPNIAVANFNKDRPETYAGYFECWFCHRWFIVKKAKKHFKLVEVALSHKEKK